ncbi:pre-mRNA-splicing factor SYF1-like [Dendronephthya gigantea]|uniref:pre-mRNA-splicing factor SYF1-like n=1 Tax=Dendronephthya gigantea TaxID=151771 RepID=UPI00106ACEC9|nr:pre-mRNA-splicing factor SYF1-like [Dendronephthya gigantea]
MSISSKVTKNLIIEEDDLPFEEEILRNPYSVKCWSRYLEHKKSAPKSVKNLIFERSLKELPGSYKLWYIYLKECRRQVRGKPISDSSYEDVNNTFERALVFMHKMPRIWLDYCQFLMDQHQITRIRRTFDRALRALPITQHYRIWPLYLKFVRSYPIPETAVRVYRRYLKLLSNNTEDYIDYLKSVGRLDEAASKLADIVNQEKFVSKEGKSNHQLWHDLCQLISKNPDKVKSLKVADIIRGGLRRFTDSLGQLWCSLADYFIRSGHFEKARDVYEEAIQTVMTVRDFGQVFDAYAQFEESMINTKMEEAAEQVVDEDDETDLELRLARFENLMDRRPLLLSSVLLRQNPHNVHEWHKRVKLFEGKPKDVINTYTEAVQTVDPKQATGKPHTLWVEFAKFYEKHKQIAEARVIFEKATKVSYRRVDDLASVWCEFAEMEIRNENYKKALDVMKQGTAMPSTRTSFYDESETVQKRLHKSLKVWSMYADLEESLGTFESTKAVYNRILDLKIANPQIIINFAVFLEEHRYFEESFKVFERGVAMFKWPNVFDIWNTYLMKFIKRYGGTKLERIRDLFEQALEKCPAKFAKAFYLMYARLEEDHGLARHAMAIYDRATKAVMPEEQFEIFNIYIKKAAEIFGVTHTREIYEKAIEVLGDDQSRDMCVRFAELERKLGEIDRARALYMHASQIADPRATASFWETWHDFEVHHGNEDTFREMLRIKRSVQAKYNTQVNFMSAQMLAASQAMSDTSTGTSVDDMEKLEKQAQSLAEQAKKNQANPKGSLLFVRGEASEEQSLEEMARSANPEEISIDEDDEDEEEKVEEVQLEQQSIPSKVFGSLAKDD